MRGREGPSPRERGGRRPRNPQAAAVKCLHVDSWSDYRSLDRGGFNCALYPNLMILQTGPAREGFAKAARREKVDTFLACGIR